MPDSNAESPAFFLFLCPCNLWGLFCKTACTMRDDNRLDLKLPDCLVAVIPGALLLLCCAVFMFLISCVRIESGGLSRARTSPPGVRADARKGVDSGTGPAVLVSAVGYPEGFDWRRDSVYGAVSGASLMVLHASDTVLTIPAGAPPVGTLSPDMMHFLDGHFYVETIDGDQTVILRDGAELFRYPGREVIRGMMSGGGSLYTLGQRRSSAGFTLRKDGDLLLSSDAGYISGSMGELGYGQTGALYDGGGGVPTFAYWRPLYAEDGPLAPREWFFVENATAQRVLFAEDWEAIFDARRLSGVNCFVLMKTDGSRPVLQVGQDEYDMTGTLIGEPAADYRLYRTGDSVKFYGTYNYTGTGHARYSPYEPVNTACWSQSGRATFYAGEGHLYADSLGTAFIRTSGGRITSIASPSGTYKIRDTCRIFSHDCASLAGEDFYVALTPSTSGARPRLWHNGKETEIPVNGYLTGVYVIDPKSTSWIRRD